MRGLICYDIRFPELALLMQQRLGCTVLACSSARPPEGEGEQVLHAQLDLAQVALARQAIPTGVQRRHDLYRLTPVDPSQRDQTLAHLGQAAQARPAQTTPSSLQ